MPTDLEIALQQGGTIKGQGTDIEKALAAGGKIQQPAGEVQGPEQEKGFSFRGATFTREAPADTKGFLGLGKGDPFRTELEEIGTSVKEKAGKLKEAIFTGAAPEKGIEFGATILNALSPFKDPVTGERPVVEAGKIVLKLGAGTVELGIPGEQGQEKFARAYGNFIAEKYGGDTAEEIRENWLEAIEDNAFEVASDFAGFTTAFGGALRLTSLGGKVKLLNETGKIFTEVGSRLDPIAGLTGVVARAAQSRKAVNSLVKSAVNFSVDPKLTKVQKLARVDKLAAEFLTAEGPDVTAFRGKNKGLRVKRSSIDKIQRDIDRLKSKVNNIVETTTKEGFTIKTDVIVKGIDDILEDMDKFGLGGVEEIVNRKKVLELRKQFINAKGVTMTPAEVQKLKKGLNLGFTANVQSEWSQVVKTVNDRIRDVSMKAIESIHPQIKSLNEKTGVKIELAEAIASRLDALEKKPPIPTLGLVSAGLATGVVGGAAVESISAGAAFAMTAFVAGKILTSPNVQIKIARALNKANMQLAKAGKLGVLSRAGFQTGRLEDIPGLGEEETELGLPAAKVIPQQLRTLR